MQLRQQEQIEKIDKTTGQSIPNIGFFNKILLYIERVTGERNIAKFLLQGIILTTLLGLPTVFASVLRAKLYRVIFGQIGKGCLIEKNVRLSVPSRIFMGDRVFLGEYSYLDPEDIKARINLGDNVHISRLCSLRGRGGSIVIGDSVHLGRNTYINGIGGVEIGRECLLGPNVQLISGNHIFDDPSVPIRLQGTKREKIVIGDDVWLGMSAIVLPGVNIATGCVIGTGAVVTKDIPPYSIAIGVPAKVVRKREISAVSVQREGIQKL